MTDVAYKIVDAAEWRAAVAEGDEELEDVALEADVEVADLEEVDVADTISQAATGLHDRLTDSKLELKVVIAPEAGPLRADGKRERLRWEVQPLRALDGGEVAGLLVERGGAVPVLEDARLGAGRDALPEPLRVSCG